MVRKLELQNVTDMMDISILKYFSVGLKRLREHAILQNQAFFGRDLHKFWARFPETRLI